MLYKVVRLKKNGRRYSQYIDTANKHPFFPFTNMTLLSYRLGEVTKAPDNSLGVFTYPSLKEAKELLSGNTFRCGGHIAIEIYECEGIGEQKSFNEYWDFPRFPAIRLLKLVEKE